MVETMHRMEIIMEIIDLIAATSVAVLEDVNHFPIQLRLG